jgi:ATP-dependent DNA helicase RecG
VATWREAVDRVLTGTTADVLEDQTLEFKSAQAPLKETLRILADAAVCFANADGGTIVVGVADRTIGQAALEGLPPGLSVEAVRRAIFDRTSPPITVIAATEEVAGRAVLVVTVAPAMQPCATSNGTATRRLDKECRPFPPEQQRDWLSARGLLDWSEHITDARVVDCDPEAVALVRRALRATGKSDLASMSDERLLEDLRLAEQGRLRRAGVLLVGNADQLAQKVPTHGYSFQHRPTAGQEALFRLRETRPLLVAVEQLMSAIESRSVVVPLNLVGGVQLTLEQLPKAAVRELVVNAFVHRSYETNGTVDVEHSPEALTITSPGGLVSGVTPENILTHPSTPRNRLLMESVSLLGIAERTGQGIDRVYRELLRVGKAPVVFHDSGILVSAVVEGARGDESFARFVASLEPPLQNDIEVLLVVRTLCARPTVTAPMVAKRIQRSLVEADRLLHRLTEGDHPLLARTKRASYRLRPEQRAALGRAVSYRTSDAGEFDDKVADHIAEFGVITNRTLQRMFDMTVFAARDLLRDLQTRGIVVKLSDATSGPGVQYGPGPNLPARRNRRSARHPQGDPPV